MEHAGLMEDSVFVAAASNAFEGNLELWALS